MPPTDTINLAPFIDHTTEADLVREKIKDGDRMKIPRRQGRAEPQKPLHPRPGAGAGGGFDQGAGRHAPVARLISG